MPRVLLVGGLIDVGQRMCRAGGTSLSVDEIPDLAWQVGKLAGIPAQLGGML